MDRAAGWLRKVVNGGDGLGYLGYDHRVGQLAGQHASSVDDINRRGLPMPAGAMSALRGVARVEGGLYVDRTAAQMSADHIAEAHKLRIDAAEALLKARNEALDATIDAPTIEEIVSEATRLQRAHEAAMPLTQAKAARAAEVESLVVTTTTGKAFDGNEEAQGRMARAVVAMGEADTTLWVLADNTPARVTLAELREALRLASEAQTAIWVRPYQ